MRIELIEVAALLAAYIALPRIAVTVTTLVQKIKSLVGKRYSTVRALQTARTRIRPRRRRWFASRVRVTARAVTVIIVAAVIIVRVRS